MDGELLDEGIALYFRAPHSYTGEDVLELQGHGGPAVLRRVLDSCLAAGRDQGLRLAEPGEFTRRAFLNDRMDLAQAEAVADLIDASSVAAARARCRANSRPASTTCPTASSTCACWSRPRWISPKRKSTSLKIPGPPDAGRAGRRPRPPDRPGPPGRDPARRPARGAGRPAQRRQVQPAQRAGRRRHRHRHAHRRHHARQGGAGNPYRRRAAASSTPPACAKPRTRWKASASPAAGRKSNAPTSSCTCRTPPSPATNSTPRSPPACRRADAEGVQQGGSVIHSFSAGPGELGISAKRGLGLDALRAELLKIAGWNPGAESPWLARERHLHALQAAAEHLALAGEHAEQDDRVLDLFAEELRLAHESLSGITGKFTSDDLLGRFF